MSLCDGIFAYVCEFVPGKFSLYISISFCMFLTMQIHTETDTDVQIRVCVFFSVTRVTVYMWACHCVCVTVYTTFSVCAHMSVHYYQQVHVFL